MTLSQNSLGFFSVFQDNCVTTQELKRPSGPLWGCPVQERRGRRQISLNSLLKISETLAAWESPWDVTVAEFYQTAKKHKPEKQEAKNISPKL